MGRDRFAKQSLGYLYPRIKQSRTLMVGAGGIGCELLKNLVLTGFGEIHIVDLDTIDLSNLNRQFLFRQEHIKKSKALVAKESAAKFNPHIKLEAHHANIKDPQFNIEWFQSFGLVFNALDNLDARRHVNKMCLAANVALIESGTTGFNGQVQPIIKGKTECYDCSTKEVPKSFPVCTIRSTPSQPIHCIVWAKSYLFTEMFGTSEDETPEFDHSEDSENAKEIENLRQESQALNSIRQSMGSDDFARKVFDKVFKDDINRLRSMEDMWKTRKQPNALDFDRISKGASGTKPYVAQQDQKAWTVAETFTVFCDSLRRLSARLQTSQAQSGADTAAPVLIFDKDDEDTLDFVAASANLRSIIFGIESKSKFDIKQMAGNIIPAIATTNAMTASLCVMQAFKVMRGDINKAKMVFLERSAARVINSDTLKPPNPNCNVCGVMSSALIVDPNRATLNDLVEDVLKTQLGYGDEFSINNEVGTLYDPDLDDNLSKKFSDLGVKADSFLTIIDDDEESPRVNLSLTILEKSLPGDTKAVQLPGKLDIARKPKDVPAPTSNGDTNGHVKAESIGLKRKRSLDEHENGVQQDHKRGKIQMPSKAMGSQVDDLVIEDDSNDGAIVIDD
ncbi:MAG: E1 ubiquitin-activating protein uba2 [Alectoria fallacina]|uniref:Ubiquitin-activating enzyme E1-like n=1 Tax=Alectoria fallacina TaxID=1903189 RepID=A0A8H3EQ64_9LECA|nr:MAG: E1 ubiquitin-activating protein uba2 [Alectoria fallacina]